MKRLRHFILLLPLLLAAACGRVDAPSPGVYRAVIQTGGGELPLLLRITEQQGTPKVELARGSQWISTTSRLQAGVLQIQLPDDGGDISAELSRKGMKGTWRATSQSKTKTGPLPFTAQLNDSHRFVKEPALDNADISGDWLLESAPSDTLGDKGMLRASFTQTHSLVDGYLDLGNGRQLAVLGQVNGETVFFGGLGWGHALLFKGEVNSQGVLAGEYWDGAGKAMKWSAEPMAEPPPADATTEDPTRTTALPWGLWPIR